MGIEYKSAFRAGHAMQGSFFLHHAKNLMMEGGDCQTAHAVQRTQQQWIWESTYEAFVEVYTNNYAMSYMLPIGRQNAYNSLFSSDSGLLRSTPFHFHFSDEHLSIGVSHAFFLLRAVHKIERVALMGLKNNLEPARKKSPPLLFMKLFCGDCCRMSKSNRTSIATSFL